MKKERELGRGTYLDSEEESEENYSGGFLAMEFGGGEEKGVGT